MDIDAEVNKEGNGSELGGSRWSRRRRLVIGGLGLLLVLGLIVLLAPTPLVDPVVHRAMARYGGPCADLVGLDVDSGSWPAVARAAAGEYRDVSAHVDEMRVGELSYYDVRFSASKIDVAPLGGLLSDRDPQLHGGEASATMRLDDIEVLLAEYGFAVELTGDGSTMQANVTVPVIGDIRTTVNLAAVDGDLELTFAPLDLFVLPAIHVPLPDPFSLDAAEVDGEVIRVDSTIEGTIPADEFGCDAAPTTADP